MGGGAKSPPVGLYYRRRDAGGDVAPEGTSMHRSGGVTAASSEPAILIITGPPGSGKTTVAQLVAARRRRAVHIESDLFFRFVRSGFIEPWKPEAHTQNVVVMGALSEATARYARAGYFTVVDGVISPRWFLEPVHQMLGAHGLAVAYAILRPDLDTAVARAMARGSAGLAEPAVIARLFDDFNDLGALEGHVIDNAALTAIETADAIEGQLHAGKLLV